MYKLTEEQKQELAVIQTKRREAIRTSFTASRQRMVDLKKLQRLFAESDGPLTVPEISEATGFPTDRALWYVTALKKYGIVGERENDGGYFRYGLEKGATEIADDEHDDE